MAVLQLASLAKKQTILNTGVAGPAVDEYVLGTAVAGSPIYFESLLWVSAPSESLTEQYPAVPSQAYDWSAAPEWASWAAFDENGIGHWFLDRPILDEYNGRWRASVTEKRSWPMYGNVALTRGWRSSLGFRPVQVTDNASATSSCSCPTSSDTVITDVTGYIAVTMGEATLLPESCATSTSQTTTTSNDVGAVVSLEQSDDGINWYTFGRSILTSINSPVYFTHTPTMARIRAAVISVWGPGTFATVTISQP